jgi:uncharacterized protein YegP (UPF0339 family)
VGGYKARWEIFQGKDGKWYYHKKSAFGRTSQPSQGYSSKSGAKRAALKDDAELVVTYLYL